MMRKIEFEIELPDRNDKDDVERYKWEYQIKYKRGYRKRRKHITLSLESIEHERLKEKAKLEGKPLTRYILDGFYASEKKADVKSRAYFNVIKELNRIGVNINQIAKQLNSRECINEPYDLRSIKDELESIKIILRT